MPVVSLNTPPLKLRPGEYTFVRGCDSEAERADARATLRRNGCKSVRFETLADGRLQVHGYMAYLSGADPV